MHINGELNTYSCVVKVRTFIGADYQLNRMKRYSLRIRLFPRIIFLLLQ